MSSSQASQSSLMSRNASQANCIDPLDSLLDLSEYDNMSYQSPSISSSDSNKLQFVRPVSSTPTANTILPSNQQTLSGPSHPYDMHKQQTGIPTGALATTMAINNNAHMYAGYGYLSGVSQQGDDYVDLKFNSNPSSGSFDSLNMDMDYETQTVDPAFFFPPLPAAQGFSKPNGLGTQESVVVPFDTMQQHSNNVGRLWPGMHQQQAAMAKAQAQQKQQQRLIVQQQQQHQRQKSAAHAPAPQQQQKPKGRPATDPIVEEKISQLLNSMRQNSVATSMDDDDAATPNGNNGHGHRSRKDEEDMDEDERLLASEEGKKLSSKERRQLRNKVSARAFRSRRKEYIGQLEGEIAGKVNENHDLRAQNRALVEENTRLQDLTRMLLSSPSFAGFLDTLSTNPNASAPQQQQQQNQQPTPPSVPEQRQPENRQNQVRKDVNPYAAQQQQDMNINYAMIPEQPLDFSMLDLNNNDFIYQPQVFSVHEVPEVAIDTSILSGKPSQCSFFRAEDDKLNIPVFTPAATKAAEVAVAEPEPVADEEFDSDPTFALYAPSPLTSTKPLDLDTAAIIANIKPAKALLKFELVDAAVVERAGNRALNRVQRLCSGLDAVAARLEALTIDL